MPIRPTVLQRLASRGRRSVKYLRGVFNGHPGVRFGRGVKLLGPDRRPIDRERCDVGDVGG